MESALRGSSIKHTSTLVLHCWNPPPQRSQTCFWSNQARWYHCRASSRPHQESFYWKCLRYVLLHLLRAWYVEWRWGGTNAMCQRILSGLTACHFWFAWRFPLSAGFTRQAPPGWRWKPPGAVTQNCVFCKITCMAAFSLWNTPAQQDEKTVKIIQTASLCGIAKPLKHEKKLSQTTHPFEVYWASFSHLHTSLPLV